MSIAAFLIYVVLPLIFSLVVIHDIRKYWREEIEECPDSGDVFKK